MGLALDELRRRHSVFRYEKYSFSTQGEDLILNFTFYLPPDITFTPQVRHAAHLTSKLNPDLLNNLVFHLGLIETLSYWKAACSPRIDIQAGALTAEQTDWWHNLILKGMGEFFYQNRIDFTIPNFLHLISCTQGHFTSQQISLDNSKFLTLVGGGKDSAVALEVIKNNQQALLLNPTPAALEISQIAGIDSPIIIERSIDPKLLQLNQQGYLNGHTPLSAYLAFLSLLVASLFGFRHIVVANERSSDEANVDYLGHKINHQYSKTLDFEHSFRGYVARYISPSLNYFSLLRPLWEIQVSRIFSSYPQYFSTFKSCNVNRKQNSWCGHCAKCLSTFILLYLFIPEATISIFGHNLIQDSHLADLMAHLTGQKLPKPFECIGTIREIKAALNSPGNVNLLLKNWGSDGFIPESLKTTLKQLSHV
jgi:UDP-N-acetyl-alpha-D-muramoyl-L-alanyl-L-glutamate epimerase